MSEAVAPESQPAAVGEALPEEGAAKPADPASAPKPESDADKNWRALREQTDYWRDRAYQLERERETHRQPERREEVPEKPKTLADFGYDELQFAAYSGQQAAQLAEQRGREAARQELARERADQARAAAQASFTEKQTAFAKDTPDYHDVVSNPRFVQSEALIGELMASEEGPALAYYLANNLNEANRLNAMTPVEVARAVTRLESKVIAERAKAKNQIPSQPAPAPKLDGGQGSGASAKPDTADSDNLSDAEWLRRRNAQVKARNRN